MRQGHSLRIAFAPWMVAGMRTQWENMRPYMLERPGIHVHVVEIHPFRAGGLTEALPLIPASLKGNLRSTMSTWGLFRLPRLDALWIDGREMLPFALSKGLLQRTVIVSTTDATSTQQAQFGGLYAKSANDSLQGRVRDAIDTFCMHRATVLNPWSEWAARSMYQDYGVPDDKIHVIPPGIDLSRWSFLPRHRATGDVVRLLFVGGDLERKGGDLLLDVFAKHLRGRCELHMVTRTPVPAQPGVIIYSDFSPNDPGLRALYNHCDLFVLPTRADCFSLAALEAMATGLPVVTTAVGGIPEIVADEQSGFLIAPDDGTALLQRILALLEDPARRIRMGTCGRRIVETRFDAIRNAGRLLDLMIETCEKRALSRSVCAQC